MNSVSPSEDLCILAAVYNNPEKTWSQISQYIHQKYLKEIPAELCEMRYETFLKHIEQIHEISEIMPYLQFQNEKQQKIPSNFIFHYIQLKKRLESTSDNKFLSFVGGYERRLIYDLFYGIKNNEQKNSDKQNEKKYEDQFINCIYKEIKQRITDKSVLNEKILSQKVQQIIFEIIEKVNDILQSSKEQKIEDQSTIIRLFKANCLIDQRRQIFELYLLQKEMNLSTALLIAGKFRYVLTVFAYDHLKKEIDNDNNSDNESEKTFEHHENELNYQKQIESILHQDNKNIEFNIFFENEPKIEDQQMQLPQQNAYCKDIHSEITDAQSNHEDKPQLGTTSYQNRQHYQQRQINSHQTRQNQTLPPLANSGLQIFSFSNMQISNNNQYVMEINQEKWAQQKAAQEQIKIQAKIEQLEEIKVEVEEENSHDNDTAQQDKPKIKKYRIIKKKRAPPPKLPKFCKTTIVIND